MTRFFELMIGLRYTRARGTNLFVSIYSIFCIVSIALGVWALIVVMSVMNGFERELQSRILGMTSHATIASFDGGLTNWEAFAEIAKSDPRVLGVAPYIEGEGMVRRRGILSGVVLRGIDPALEAKVSDVAEQVKVGELSSLTPGAFNLIVGSELARAVGVEVGDKLDLMIPQASVTPAGFAPRFRRFTVSGIFEVGMYQYDRAWVYMHATDAAALQRMGDKVSGIRLKLTDMFDAPQIAFDIRQNMPGFLYVSDWTREHANFFRAVKTEKTVMFAILSVIVLVASINIISTLFMAVTDKRSDIAIMRTIGVTPRSVMLIFIVQGTMIGLIGTVLGTATGVVTALNVESIVPAIESLFNTDLLAPDVYYISDLPSELRGSDVIRIALLAGVLSLLATIIPAFRAARTQPAEALRHE